MLGSGSNPGGGASVECSQASKKRAAHAMTVVIKSSFRIIFTVIITVMLYLKYTCQS